MAINETGWGSSELTRRANNYFGIKADVGEGTAGRVVADTREVVNGRVVTASDLSLPPPGQRPAGMDSDSVTREMIEVSLSKARGNISRAAQSLGLSRQALYRRMERLGIKS